MYKVPKCAYWALAYVFVESNALYKTHLTCKWTAGFDLFCVVSRIAPGRKPGFVSHLCRPNTTICCNERWASREDHLQAYVSWLNSIQHLGTKLPFSCSKRIHSWFSEENILRKYFQNWNGSRGIFEEGNFYGKLDFIGTMIHECVKNWPSSKFSEFCELESKGISGSLMIFAQTIKGFRC